MIDCHRCRYSQNLGAIAGCGKLNKILINPKIESCEHFVPFDFRTEGYIRKFQFKPWLDSQLEKHRRKEK